MQDSINKAKEIIGAEQGEIRGFNDLAIEAKMILQQIEEERYLKIVTGSLGYRARVIDEEEEEEEEEEGDGWP